MSKSKVNYIRKLLKREIENLSVNGLNDSDFLSQIGEFYSTLIENYKTNGNIKNMNICIEDFMESINKNGDSAIRKFIKLILEEGSYKYTWYRIFQNTIDNPMNKIQSFKQCFLVSRC